MPLEIHRSNESAKRVPYKDMPHKVIKSNDFELFAPTTPKDSLSCKKECKRKALKKNIYILLLVFKNKKPNENIDQLTLSEDLQIISNRLQNMFTPNTNNNLNNNQVSLDPVGKFAFYQLYR